MTEPIGDIGARDQQEARIRHLVHEVAFYYHAARAAGLPREVAFAAVLDYQEFLLHCQHQAPEAH